MNGRKETWAVNFWVATFLVYLGISGAKEFVLRIIRRGR